MSRKFIGAAMTNATLFTLVISTALAVEETADAAPPEGASVGVMLVGIAAILVVAYFMAQRAGDGES